MPADPTGAERYLTDRLTDPEYREAYDAALAAIREQGPDINIDAARRVAHEYRQDGMPMAAQVMDDLLDRIEYLESLIARYDADDA